MEPKIKRFLSGLLVAGVLFGAGYYTKHRVEEAKRVKADIGEVRDELILSGYETNESGRVKHMVSIPSKTGYEVLFERIPDAKSFESITVLSKSQPDTDFYFIAEDFLDSSGRNSRYLAQDPDVGSIIISPISLENTNLVARVSFLDETKMIYFPDPQNSNRYLSLKNIMKADKLSGRNYSKDAREARDFAGRFNSSRTN